MATFAKNIEEKSASSPDRKNEIALTNMSQEQNKMMTIDPAIFGNLGLNPHTTKSQILKGISWDGRAWVEHNGRMIDYDDDVLRNI